VPTAESIGNRTLSIPFYPRLHDATVERVIDAVREVVRAGRLRPSVAAAD
jgi:dTDP-4-amino-4,6-dideoxygalactose transaminase